MKPRDPTSPLPTAHRAGGKAGTRGLWRRWGGVVIGVAIPALFGYNWLSSRSDAIVADMAVFVDEFATRLAEEQGDGRQMRPVLQQA